MSLFSSSNNYIGVDIGTSSVKMVELGKKANKIELITYGYSEGVREGFSDDWLKNPGYVAMVIDKIYRQMGGSAEKAVATLPAFSVFSSIINLHNVDKKSLAQAVEWEAKKFIPLPLEEMILDWKIITSLSGKKEDTNVFLTGSPKKLVKKYVDIFRKTIVTLASLETETFSLIRSLLGDDKSTVMIVEIGAANADICVVKNGIPVVSRSLDMGGMGITKAIASALNIGTLRAEQFKRDLGVSANIAGSTVVPKTIAGSAGAIVEEVRYLINVFQNKSEDKIEKVILSGGSAMLPNLAPFMSEKLNMNVVVGDPWARVFCQPELKPILSEIGPSFSVAIGSALRELE
ncbi:MAG: type IV pilus assembly protein PilM [Patescibacteria group bacterium]|jgi:type IV pilus assembly protein PilM